MRTEISQAKRENTHYLTSVEKGKEIEAIVQRKRKRGATEEEVRKSLRCLWGLVEAIDFVCVCV